MIERSVVGVIIPELILLVILFFIYTPLSFIIFFFVLFTLYFFRDPERDIGEGVVSPADGKIDYIDDGRIEIFMSPFDCHVNRSPTDGIVKRITYKKGKFYPAFKKSHLSERNEIVIHSNDGEFIVTQIAGFFARRIICYVKEGNQIKKGQKIGMIRFGSRVVLEIPENYRILRKKGDKIKAGETIAEKIG